MTPSPSDEVADAVGEALDAASHGHGRRLPHVLHDVPAAVLLVDLDRGEVVHANPAALDLVHGELTLPVAASAWSAAAGLTPTQGGAYGETGSPVERAAQGHAVFGEPLLAPSRALWATALPLPGPERQALVVLFELDT
ncbi:MAG: hypothetical protein WCD35_11130, partial [Mycobacteriales bacterium]